MKLLVFLFVMLLSIGSGIAHAEDQIYPPYPNDYQFGADGDANDGHGKDGWPSDHPNNPNPGVAGDGGDGINGGRGGNGGRQATPGAGCGGKGGNGGANTNGRGGDAGRGGDGEDCGGEGGKGGNGSTTGGAGGCGGDSSGGGRGGNGGKGGDNTAPGGVSGIGGCGGNSLGIGGCSGDGGDSGNYYWGPGLPSRPTYPGLPGQGEADRNDPDDNCGGLPGQTGRPRDQPQMADNAPVAVRYLYGFEQLAYRANEPLENVVSQIHLWRKEPGPAMAIGSGSLQNPFQADGSILHNFLVHPESLAAEVVRITLEYRDTGPNPSISVVFGLNLQPSASTPLALDDDWFRINLTVVRPNAGEPMGAHLDTLVYETNDVEVRHFVVYDMGIKGDVNLDGVVDVQDLHIVQMNLFTFGDLGIEDGDTDLSGTVDSTDALNVLQAIGN